MSRRRRARGRDFAAEAVILSAAEVDLTCPLLSAAIYQLEAVVRNSITYVDLEHRKRGIDGAFERTITVIREGATLQLRRAHERALERVLRLEAELDTLKRSHRAARRR